MLFTSPIPFREALDFLRQKVLLPTSASSAQLAELPAQILARAQFSARTMNAGHLQTIQDVIDKILQGKTDSATARLNLKESLKAISYDPYAEPGVAGTIKDLSSDPRLNLIIQMQTEMAEGFGKYLQSQDPAALDAFPAQELFRAESRLHTRDWPAIWQDAGGEFYDGGRMIALKSDPIWMAISDFDLPYPPFKYGSGMWVRDISRSEVEELGLIAPGAIIEPTTPRSFSEGGQVSLAGFSPDLQQAILDSMGDRAEFRNGILHLKNSDSLSPGRGQGEGQS
ncbi:MAG: hypothetical protein NT011_13460 [Kiritimatiellaeota bacterium]|nr:hypothetical protein [Kiritimatiellota bacterium]